MIEREAAEAAMEAVDGLIASAIKILNRKPFDLGIAPEAICWLTMDGGNASLVWTREIYGEYDEGLKVETTIFPAFLLFVAKAEVKAWAKKETAARKAQDEEQNMAFRASLEQRERATYEALKAKFDPAPANIDKDTPDKLSRSSLHRSIVSQRDPQ